METLDLGINWYPNQWLKISTIWERAWFGDPVTFKPGRTSHSNDMWLLRAQVWF